MQDLPQNVLFTVIGLAMLYFGGEALVQGAVRLGRRIGLAPLVIGLTIVSFGTSSPELVVSLQAALTGFDDVAVANVVGSNIANIALILGLAAVIRTLPACDMLLRRDVPVMVASAVLLALMLRNDVVSRPEGLMLLAGLVAYIWHSLAHSPPVEEVQELIGHANPHWLDRRQWVPVVIAVAGMIVLALGGRLVVQGATGLARSFGVSDAVVGLTIVAIGTSLPEVAASTVAAARGYTAIAIGNAVGSNILNVLLVLGLTASIQPLSAAGISGSVVLVMIAVSLLLWLFVISDRGLSRQEGVMLLAGYFAFNVYVALG